MRSVAFRGDRELGQAQRNGRSGRVDGGTAAALGVERVELRVDFLVEGVSGRQRRLEAVELGARLVSVSQLQEALPQIQRRRRVSRSNCLQNLAEHVLRLRVL